MPFNYSGVRFKDDDKMISFMEESNFSISKISKMMNNYKQDYLLSIFGNDLGNGLRWDLIRYYGTHDNIHEFDMLIDIMKEHKYTIIFSDIDRKFTYTRADYKHEAEDYINNNYKNFVCVVENEKAYLAKYHI